MLRLAGQPDEASQQRAAAMFEELGPQLAEGDPASMRRDLLPLLEEGLKARDGRSRKSAASLLAIIATIRDDSAPLLSEFTPLLSHGLQDADESVRVSCAVALASQKPEPGAAAIAALRTLAERQLERAEPETVLLVTAVSGLAECVKCTDTEGVILKALGGVQDPEPKRRLIMAIGEGASRHPRVVHRLAKIATQEEGKVRLAAVLALGNYGPAARPAIPALRVLLEQSADDAELEQALGSALKRILGGEE